MSLKMASLVLLKCECLFIVGYCFLLFQDEMSVQTLIEHCIVDDEKLYWCVSSPTMKDKPVSDQVIYRMLLFVKVIGLSDQTNAQCLMSGVWF